MGKVYQIPCLVPHLPQGPIPHEAEEEEDTSEPLPLIWMANNNPWPYANNQWTPYADYPHQNAIRHQDSWRYSQPQQQGVWQAQPVNNYYPNQQESYYQPQQNYNPRSHPYAGPISLHQQQQPAPWNGPALGAYSQYMAPAEPRAPLPALPDTDRRVQKPRPPPPRQRRQYTTFGGHVAAELDVDCRISACKIELSWKPFGGRKDIHYQIECACLDDTKPGQKPKRSAWDFDQPWTQTHRELKTSQGSTYCVNIECRSTTDNRLLATAFREVKAMFSYEEQQMLYDKAVAFVGTSAHQFEFVYRCKPKPYWDEIHNYRGDIMEKYIKDFNGQPANRINGLISGLFFSARLLGDGSLPPQSPFGNVRMLVRAEALLDPTVYNMYFADFYCNYVTHYVTIVICKKLSDTDRYCRENLVMMKQDNPFLKIVPRRDGGYYGGSKYDLYVTRGVWVEIYYTEDIPLSMGRFDGIVATGAGTSKLGGLPNNKSCDQCNLYVQKASEVNGQEPVEADDYDADAFDVTMEADGLNSTFCALIHEKDKSGNSDEWEHLVEVICGLVDSVCSAEGEDREKDPIGTSDGVIDRAQAKMESELANCNDEKVKKAAALVQDFLAQFRKDRDEVTKVIRRVQLARQIFGTAEDSGIFDDVAKVTVDDSGDVIVSVEKTKESLDPISPLKREPVHSMVNTEPNLAPLGEIPSVIPVEHSVDVDEFVNRNENPKETVVGCDTA